MVQLSLTAIREIQRMQAKHSNPEALLRLGVQPGGCANWYYTLSLTEAVASDDQVFATGGIQVVMDGASCPYLTGLTLDYSEDLMGGGFRFTNPNAVSHCGCGNSFSTEPGESAFSSEATCLG